MAHRVSCWIVRLRWVIVVAWCAAAVLMIVVPPSGAPKGELTGLVPDDAASIATRVRSAELFAAPLLTETLIVQRDPDGLPAAAQRRVLERAGRLSAGLAAAAEQGPVTRVGDLALDGFPELAYALPFVNDRRALPGAREHGTTGITYLFFPPRYSIKTRTRVARAFAAQLMTAPGDAFVGVTGATPARAEQVELIKQALPLIDLATVLVVLLIIGVHFRSAVAPLVVLATVGISLVVARGLVDLGSGATGITVPGELEPLIVVLLLGVVADYGIFFLDSMRSALASDHDVRAAAVAATERTLPLVLAAVVVVAAGTASVAVARLGFFRAMGPSLAVAVLVGGAVACTLVPALMAILGRRMYWPRGVGDTVRPKKRLVAFVTAHAVQRSRRVATLITVVVAGAAVFVVGLPLGFGLIGSLPSNSEPARAARAAEAGIAPGALAPTVILLEQPGIGKRRAELVALEQSLESMPDVAGVIGPREQRDLQPVGAVISVNSNAARLFVILRADPFSAAGIDALKRVKRRVALVTRQSGLGAVALGYGGDTALAEETVAAVRDDLLRVAVAALLVNFVLIMLILRSVVAAAYLLAASALGLAATLGLLRLVFVDLLGHPDITYFVPFAAAVLLLSLGSDYTIFVAGRVWQHARGQRIRDAVDSAIAETTGPVTAAGVALATSFALLAIVPTVTFRELAFALAGGILLDAFVIRTALVPVLIHLVGETNRWPGARFAAAALPPSPIAGRAGGTPSPRDGVPFTAIVAALGLMLLATGRYLRSKRTRRSS